MSRTCPLPINRKSPWAIAPCSGTRTRLLDKPKFLQGVRRLRPIVMWHRSPLVPVLDQHSVRRIAKRKRLLEQNEISRSLCFQPCIGQKRTRPLRHIRRDADDGNIFLPMELSHVPRSLLTMAALGIVKEQQNTPLLKRKRLPVRGNDIGSFRAAKSCRRKAKAARRGGRDHRKNHAGA